MGTPRINTDQNGNIQARHDYLPFGEEIINLGGRAASNGYNADSVREKFTGYQRDLENGLDFAQARYYNNSQGKFTAVDPLLASGKSANPQTFNRYVYVTNNPLVIVDPTGAVGDYYSSSGRWLGTDGKDDFKVYFATETRQDDKSTWIDQNSIQQTSLSAVLNAQINSVPLTRGTDNQAVQALTGTVADSSIAGATGIAKGIGNFLIDSVNGATQPGGAVGYAFGVTNPFAIPNIPTNNSLEQSYNDATEVGAGIGMIFTGAVGGGEPSISVVPKATTSFAVTSDGIALPQPKYSIPSGYVENPFRPPGNGTSYGEYADGKFKERIFIHQTEAEKYPSHYHLNGERSTCIQVRLKEILAFNKHIGKSN